MNPQRDNSQPDPQFDEQVTNILKTWQNGEFPFREAVAQLLLHKQQATADEQLANQARAEHILGNLQYYRGNPDTSAQHWTRARDLYQQAGNIDFATSMEMNLGEYYRLKGDLTLALSKYRISQKSAKKFNNIRNLCIGTVNEGHVLVSLEQYDDALKAFNIGLELSTQLDDGDLGVATMRCEAYHGMAIVYLHRDDNQAAWEHALKALDVAERDGQPLQNGLANRIMGIVVTKLEKAPNPQFSSDPDHYFRKAIESFRKVDAETELPITVFSQAVSMLKRGKNKSATRKLHQAIADFNRLGMVGDVARAEKVQQEII